MTRTADLLALAAQHCRPRAFLAVLGVACRITFYGEDPRMLEDLLEDLVGDRHV